MPFPNLVDSFVRFFHGGRGGRARLAAFSGLGARGILALISFVSLPITIGYLGNEGYGLMLAVTSVVGWLQISNLGIAASLQNRLTDAVATRDERAQTVLITTACTGLLVVACFLALAGAAAFPWIDWRAVFQPATTRYLSQLPSVVALVFGCLCASIVLSFVPAVLAARQQLHVAHLGSLVTGAAGLIVLIAAVRFDWGLLGAVASTVSPSLVMGVIFAVWLLFVRGTSHTRPRRSAFSFATLKLLARGSASFWLMTLTNIALFQSDIFILTHAVGAEAVAPYGVAQRAYAQVITVFGIITGSLWVAYGHAKAIGDIAWIRRVYARVRRAQSIVFAGTLIAMVLGGEIALRWWVGAEAAPDRALVAALGAAFVVQQWTATHAMMLNGLNVIRPQLGCLALNGILAIGLGIVGAQLAGAHGLAIGTCLGYAATSAWYLPWLIRRTLDRMTPPVEGTVKNAS